ncbi:transcriptional regulator [Arenicella chitinivorans]|uniref:Transcriptional regulator n=1 Tax=Arenicella chitinivorans TaxID=1329800 RepID=A0A918RDN3_9GAMM|nr:helix-turn-helix domain-containing protein [Arenicella chitinivorans]GGZ95935.1 transcriptional regulator [Arenicella chitinivorans]
MTQLHQYIIILGAFQGVLLFALLVADRRVATAGKLLGVHCLLVALILLFPFLLFSNQPEAFSWAVGWLFYIPVCLGPLFYLYCRTAIVDRPLRLSDSVHALPVIACYLLNIDSIVFSGDEIRAWVIGAPAPNWRLWLSEYLLFGFAFFYFVLTLVTIRRLQMQAGRTLSSVDPEIFRWLWIFVGSVFIVWVAKLILSFTSLLPPITVVATDALIVLFIYMVAIAQWRSPKLFAVEKLATVQAQLEADERSAKSGSGGMLDTQIRASMIDEIKRHVESEGLFRDSGLTLTGLAEATGLSTHHVSESLNQQEGKNFNQFINDYRLDDVVQRLKAGATGTILELAMDAGFASKSTFNTLFKRRFGVTPSQYKRGVVGGEVVTLP